MRALVVQRSKLTDSEMVNLLQQGETKNPPSRFRKASSTTFGISSCPLARKWQPPTFSDTDRLSSGSGLWPAYWKPKIIPTVRCSIALKD
jgi:peptide methionine sulfoxide reductase MsrB